VLLLAELHPKTKREKLTRLLSEISNFDGYDIPHSALGLPAVLPISVAETIRGQQPDKTIIVNQRLYDVNELFVASLALTAKYTDFWIAFTRGDKPRFGRAVEFLASEDAVKIAKAYAENVRVGMMVSMRKSLEELRQRLSFPADFFLVLNFRDEASLRDQAAKLIPYLLVETERNRETLKSLNQPGLKESELDDQLSSLESRGFLGVIISTLGDDDALRRIARRI
jgi:hypothetical protein